MKNYYSLFFSCLFLFSFLNGQNTAHLAKEEAQLKPTIYQNNTSLISEQKKVIHQQKAYDDTLYYQDFAGQIPSGWVINNLAGNINNWIWDTAAPGGQYSSSVAAINSTSSSNGFLSLRADLYNTPFPSGGPVPMNVSINSPSITINPKASILVRWQQSSRYCCSSNSELVLEVSTNNISWYTYDAIDNRMADEPFPNNSTDPAEQVEINVSAALANSTTAYLRFRSTGNTHYYWMIDDLAIVEGPANNMIMDTTNLSHVDYNFRSNPPMSMVPLIATEAISFNGSFLNYGSNAQTGVGLEVEVIHDSTLNGGLGSGMGAIGILSSSQGMNVSSLMRGRDTIGYHTITSAGYYTFNFRVFSNSTNQNPSSSFKPYPLIVSDSVLAKDRGPYFGNAGPSNYVGGGNDGDRWGTLMNVGLNSFNSGGLIASSISILVSNDPLNIGSSIKPQIWNWIDTVNNLSAAIQSPPVGTASSSTSINSAMLGQWVTFPLFPPVNIASKGQYVVGWEQTAGASNAKSFSAARDRSVERFQPVLSNFVYVNDASPSWGWVTQVAAVRLNLNLATDVEEQELKSVFSIYPNPNNGSFSIKLTSSSAQSYTLRVRNNLGQEVYVDQVAVHGKKNHQIRLSELEKGLYFLSLENGNERLVKKVILH